MFFNGRCEEAIDFYKKALGAEVTMLMHKVMSIFLNLDKMIGKDFAVGLVQLKTVMEQKG